MCSSPLHHASVINVGYLIDYVTICRSHGPWHPKSGYEQLSVATSASCFPPPPVLSAAIRAIPFATSQRLKQATATSPTSTTAMMAMNDGFDNNNNDQFGDNEQGSEQERKQGAPRPTTCHVTDDPVITHCPRFGCHISTALASTFSTATSTPPITAQKTHRRLFDNQHPFQNPPRPFKNHLPPFGQPAPFHRYPFDNPHLFKTHPHPLKTPPMPFRQPAPFQNQSVPCQKPTPTVWTTCALSKATSAARSTTPPLQSKSPPIRQPTHVQKQTCAFSKTHPRFVRNWHCPFAK